MSHFERFRKLLSLVMSRASSLRHNNTTKIEMININSRFLCSVWVKRKIAFFLTNCKAKKKTSGAKFKSLFNCFLTVVLRH